jgi:hypothetical protein
MCRTSPRHVASTSSTRRALSRIFLSPQKNLLPSDASRSFATARHMQALHIFGELCHLLDIDRMVTALSRKPVILAMPDQARPAALFMQASYSPDRRSSKRVVSNLQLP